MYQAKFSVMLTKFVILLVLSGSAVQAQYTPNYSTSVSTTTLNSYYSPLAAMNRADRERLYRRKPSGGNTSNSGGSGKPTGTRSNGGSTRTDKGGDTAAATGSTTFRPVSAQPLAPHILAIAQADGSPERLHKFEKMFAETLEDYKAAVRAKGAPLNDMARCMSYFIYNTYFVSTKGRGMTMPQYEAVREFIREVFLHDRKFQQMSAHDKQEWYETMAIWGGVTMAGYLEGKRLKDSQLEVESEKNARILLEGTLGTTLNKIRFTENGIEY